MTQSILTAVLILSSGCATQAIPVPVVLEAPSELVLPLIPGTDLQCLSEKTFVDLALRDRMQTERRQTLRKIIESTHK